MTLHLDNDETQALLSALDRYTDGFGMEPDDEDRATLLAILKELERD